MTPLTLLRRVCANAVVDIAKWWRAQPDAPKVGVIVVLVDLDDRTRVSLASNMTEDAVQDALAGCYARGDSERMVVGGTKGGKA